MKNKNYWVLGLIFSILSILLAAAMDQDIYMFPSMLFIPSSVISILLVILKIIVLTFVLYKIRKLITKQGDTLWRQDFLITSMIILAGVPSQPYLEAFSLLFGIFIYIIPILFFLLFAFAVASIYKISWRKAFLILIVSLIVNVIAYRLIGIVLNVLLAITLRMF